ncbi:hypothetical protein [Gaopeijia maritima]|uniref:hypothetical protein n=1 Tax=Gaopeijia maritima TaxID=3119007 RepID=UPI003273A58E
MNRAYSRDEERALRRAVTEGRDPDCPRCGAVMDRREVPPRPDVAYVRKRRWLRCARCGGSLVVDLPR